MEQKHLKIVKRFICGLIIKNTENLGSIQVGRICNTPEDGGDCVSGWKLVGEWFFHLLLLVVVSKLSLFHPVLLLHHAVMLLGACASSHSVSTSLKKYQLHTFKDFHNSSNLQCPVCPYFSISPLTLSCG